MPPRRKQKRAEEDEAIDRQAEEKSKWAAVLEGGSDDEEDGEVLYQNKKTVFEYDFSQEHRLLNEKDPPKQEEPKVVLTP